MVKTINEASVKKEIKALRAIGFVTGIPSVAILMLCLIFFFIRAPSVYSADAVMVAVFALIALIGGFYCWMALWFAFRAQIKMRWFMILWARLSPFALGLIGFMGGFIGGGFYGGWEQGPCFFFLTGPIGLIIGIITGHRILISHDVIFDYRITDNMKERQRVRNFCKRLLGKGK